MSAFQRFPRERRLRSQKDYRRAASKGKAARGHGFTVLGTKSVTTRTDSQSEKSGGPRLGLTVSRRVGNAVVRNRVKRRVREWFRKAGGELGLERDFVVIAKPAAARMSVVESALELERLFLVAEGRQGDARR